jgi:response regulator RpfG family c-di-GMP phosphodiesterase
LPFKEKEDLVGFFASGQKRSGDMYTSQDLRLFESFSRTAAVALARSKVTKEKEREVVKVKALYNQAQKSVSSVDLDDVLDSTIDAAFKATRSDGGSIMLYNEKTKTFSINASRGLPGDIHFKKIKLGEGISGKVAMSRKGRIINPGDKEFANLLKRGHLKSAIVEPLTVGDKLVGVLNVNRVNNNDEFMQGDYELVQTIAAHIAQRIENTKLIQEDRQKDKEIIGIFNKAMETRDPYTSGHSEEVTRYSVAIAKKMGLDKEKVIKIEKAGILHDIGKIGVPDNILLKTQGLTDAEYQKIKEHPIKSMNLIIEYSKLKDIAIIALHHLERFVGNGYPKGLKGEEIPLESRILAVADSFDAMTSDRPYRDALPLSIAKEEIRKGSGTQFDPEVAGVFLKMVDKIYNKKKRKALTSELFKANV